MFDELRLIFEAPAVHLEVYWPHNFRIMFRNLLLVVSFTLTASFISDLSFCLLSLKLETFPPCQQCLLYAFLLMNKGRQHWKRMRPALTAQKQTREAQEQEKQQQI